jgi:hypothetical protein
MLLESITQCTQNAATTTTWSVRNFDIGGD